MPVDGLPPTSPPSNLRETEDTTLLLETYLCDAQYSVRTRDAAVVAVTTGQNPSISANRSQHEPNISTVGPAITPSGGRELSQSNVRPVIRPELVVSTTPTLLAANGSLVKKKNLYFLSNVTSFNAGAGERGKHSDKTSTTTMPGSVKTRVQKTQLPKQGNKNHHVKIHAPQHRINTCKKKSNPVEVSLANKNTKIQNQRGELSAKESALKRLRQKLNESTDALAANKRENDCLASLLIGRDAQITRLEAELRTALDLKSVLNNSAETQIAGKQTMNKGVATQHARIKTLETQVEMLTNELGYKEAKLRILEEQLKDSTGPACVQTAPVTCNGSGKRHLSSNCSEGSQGGEVEQLRDGPLTKKPKMAAPVIESDRERLLMKLMEEYKIARQAVGLPSPPST